MMQMNQRWIDNKISHHFHVLSFFSNSAPIVNSFKNTEFQTYLKTGGQQLHDIFSTVCPNDANESVLDR